MSSDKELKQLWKRRPRISVRKLNKRTILIEGNSTGLKFLGTLLLSLSEAHDCGEEWSPDGPGSKLFSRDSKLGIYLHRLPCRDLAHKKKAEQ
jgi:hypothetical protein